MDKSWCLAQNHSVQAIWRALERQAEHLVANKSLKLNKLERYQLKEMAMVVYYIWVRRCAKIDKDHAELLLNSVETLW